MKNKIGVITTLQADKPCFAALKRQGEFGGEAFADFHEMLDRCAPDAVWLCTPPAIRREPLLACADRKIPVFCEENFYRLNLNTGSLTSDRPITVECSLYGGKKKKPAPKNAPVQFQQDARSIYQYENDVFLEQVATGNWRNNPSDYNDGLKSFHLTLACGRALAGGLIKV